MQDIMWAHIFAAYFPKASCKMLQDKEEFKSDKLTNYDWDNLFACYPDKQIFYNKFREQLAERSEKKWDKINASFIKSYEKMRHHLKNFITK